MSAFARFFVAMLVGGLAAAMACSSSPDRPDGVDADNADAEDDTEGDGNDSEGSETPDDGNDDSTGDEDEGDDSTGDDGDDGLCGNAEGQLLRPELAWNQTIEDVAVASDSSAVIDYLQANVQSGVRFQIDFSLTVLEAPAGTTRYEFDPTGDHYLPDCDLAPIPIPEGGHLEGESGYTCDNDGDCHLIVVDRVACRLYEQWRADFAGEGQFQGGCLAVWDLEQAYPETLRGDYCTSADAAGLPIAPLLFTPDEVAAGQIRHALRFIVPNANIRADRYVRPGTHSTPATAGPDAAPPYSARLRLKASADLSGLSAPAQVVARAMQEYGIILADAGNVTFTAASDDGFTTSWEDVGLGPHDIKNLAWTDFEMVDGGQPIVWSEGDCARDPITD